jgi:tetratricopeptide (TPR) repeat protein
MIKKKEFLDNVILFKEKNSIHKNRIYAEQLQLMFEDYLRKNPYDTEVRIKFSFVLYRSLLNANISAINCLEKILEYEPNNILVSLIIFYIHQHESVIDQEVFEKLSNLQTEDTQIQSMIEYAKSWYHIVRDDYDEYENCLLKSIELCDKYLWNYVDLGQLYIKRRDLAKGYTLIKKGLENFEYVYDEQHPQDILDIEEFFNERFKGIHLSQPNYEIILESFDPKSPWITGDFTNNKKDNHDTEN